VVVLIPLLVTLAYVVVVAFSIIFGERIFGRFMRRRPTSRPPRRTQIIAGAIYSVVAFVGALAGSLIGHSEGYDLAFSSVLGTTVIFVAVSFVSSLVRGFLGVRKNASRH